MKQPKDIPIPPVRDDDVLGWFEDMAYTHGEHPLVLLGQPRTMKQAGIDPNRIRSNRQWMDALVAHTFAPAYLWLRRQYRKTGIGYSSWSIELTLDRWKAVGLTQTDNPEVPESPLSSPAKLSLQDIKKKVLPVARNQEVEPPSAQTDTVSNKARQEAAAQNGQPTKPPVPANRKLERTVQGIPVYTEPGRAAGKKRFVVFGLYTTHLIREFGKWDWPVRPVRTILRRLGIGVTYATIDVQMSLGRTNKQEAARLTTPQAELLRALTEDKEWKGKSTSSTTANSAKDRKATARSTRTSTTGGPARRPVRSATGTTGATKSSRKKRRKGGR